MVNYIVRNIDENLFWKRHTDQLLSCNLKLNNKDNDHQAKLPISELNDIVNFKIPSKNLTSDIEQINLDKTFENCEVKETKNKNHSNIIKKGADDNH